MDLLLGQVSSAEHGQRMLAGTIGLTEAAFFGATAASAFAFDRSDPSTSRSAADTFGAVAAGVSAFSLGYGIYTLARSWAGERLAAEYQSALDGGDYAHAFAVANERLRDLAATEHRERWARGVAGALFVLSSAAVIVDSELSDSRIADRFDVRVLGGGGIVLGIASIVSAILIESPIERLTTVWRRDPGLIRIEPSLAPTQGGATIGLRGTF